MQSMSRRKQSTTTNRTFLVYFEQVNKTKWEVEAKDAEAAVRRARILWREQYGQPSGTYVEEVEHVDSRP